MSKAGDILDFICTLMDKPASDPQVQQKIGELKDFITQNFWTCTAKAFKNLGDLYVNDRIFRKYMEQYHREMPEFIRDAIYIYCERTEE
jgi:hypothetical protein